MTEMKNRSTALPKEHLGLAAEYAVASELCRRRIYAQLTLGNRKRTDLLVDSEYGKMLRVQVKAKQGRVWPGCKGICGDGIVLVLVDYEHKQLEDRPDFYILRQADWKHFLEVELTQSGKKAKWGMDWKEDDLIPTTPAKRAGKRAFCGTDVTAAQVKDHQDKWDKIEKLLNHGSVPEQLNALQYVKRSEKA